ncbi:LANO_0B05490g1_1 [Lachancea nothofagi CBS 11611]|uniref:LANO_0B05490g1_1 n=1 Tax=Lachancea nothofagi CBS 11611 TaxID=1266666 RepID=A0A1G4IYK6_9SACH|nr:LANO_0B05490g1_1 [Lachancea nothofagi CBS 11611]
MEGIERNLQDLARIAHLLKERRPELDIHQSQELEKFSGLVSEAVRSMERILVPNQVQSDTANLNAHEPTSNSAKAAGDKKAAIKSRRFKRTYFYSLDSPYAHMRDKSGSFRIAPPIPDHRDVQRPQQSKEKCQSPQQIHANYLIQNLAVLDNLRNLNRLAHKSSS